MRSRYTFRAYAIIKNIKQTSYYGKLLLYVPFFDVKFRLPPTIDARVEGRRQDSCRQKNHNRTKENEITKICRRRKGAHYRLRFITSSSGGASGGQSTLQFIKHY